MVAFGCRGYLCREHHHPTRISIYIGKTAKLFIPVILGTNREGRQTENVARYVVAALNKRQDATTQLIDVRTFVLLDSDYGIRLKDRHAEYRNNIVRADGLVLVVPEYNHGYPGSLKSVLDILLEEYHHKAVGMVGVSNGPWGGTRVIESLLPVVRTLGLVAIKLDLHFPFVQDVFTAKGVLKDKKTYAVRTAQFLDELVWMAITLRRGRKKAQNIKSIYVSQN